MIYPQTAQASLAGIASIPIRATGGSIVNVGDVTDIAREPAPPLITRINRQSGCTSEQTSPTEANASRTCNADSTTASRR